MEQMQYILFQLLSSYTMQKSGKPSGPSQNLPHRHYISSTRKQEPAKAKASQRYSQNNDKGDYVKKFFQRRLQIQMKAREMVFGEMGAGGRNAQCPVQSRKSTSKRKKEQKKGQTRQHLNLDVKEAKSRKQFLKEAPMGFGSEIYSNSKIKNRREPFDRGQFVKKNKPIKNETISHLHMSLKQIIKQKLHGCRRDEKPYFFEQFQDQLRRQKVDRDRRHQNSNQEYMYNPERDNFVLMKSRYEEQEKRIINLPSTTDKRNKTQISSMSKSNGYKCLVDEELRQRLNRIIKCQIYNSTSTEREYNERMRGLSTSRTSSIRLQARPHAEEQPNSGRPSLQQQRAEIIAQLSSPGRIPQPPATEINQRSQQSSERSISAQRASLISTVLQKFEQNYLNNQKKSDSPKKSSDDEPSGILCAICQTNMDKQLWSQAQFFIYDKQVENANPSAQNYSQSISNQSEVPVLLVCGHSFHKHCLKQWFEYKTLCPLCKTAVGPQSESEQEASQSYEESVYESVSQQEALIVEPQAYLGDSIDESYIIQQSLDGSINFQAGVSLQSSLVDLQSSFVYDHSSNGFLDLPVHVQSENLMNMQHSGEFRVSMSAVDSQSSSSSESSF